MMIAPPDMPPLPRPQRSCYGCEHSVDGAVELLCLYGTMANKCSDNRSVRGLCGPAAHMYRPKHGS
jgi:hypothetical protein